MKLFISLLFLISTNAYANPTVNCFDLAVSRGLQKEAAVRLCKSAQSNAPVTCLDLARTRLASAYDQMALCSQAESTNVIECFDTSVNNRNLTPELAIVLCGHK